MRCPRCGATNTADARWCGQCYASFAPAAPAAGPERPQQAGFRKSGETVEWECIACEAVNALERTTCSACGTPMTARFAQPEAEPEPASWTGALVASAVLPGAGHYLAGRTGSGIARALLYVVWLAGGVLLLATAGASAALAAVPLLLGALVVWAGTLLDLASLRSGGRELLSGRALLWLVVTVTALLLLGALGGAARLR